MDVLRHCECYERPQAEGEEWFIGAEGEDICARCAAELLGAERDALRQQLRGAVEEHRAFVQALTDALAEHGVLAMPSWREAIDWLAAHGG
jgi:hypothetical protein